MNPEENARRMREAIEKTGWTPPQPQPVQPSNPWAALDGMENWGAGKRGRALPQYGRPNVPGMLSRGNIDLANRPTVRNPDGSISTVRSMSIGTDRGEVLIPTVTDDGRIMGDDEAIDVFERTGRNLGTFKSPRAADEYAVGLHDDQAEQYGASEAPSPFEGLEQFTRSLMHPSKGERDARALAMRPDLVMTQVMQQPGFGKGMTDPLPDNAVPGFAKPLQKAWKAPAGGWRDIAADRIEAEPREGEAFARLLTAPFSGALRDPVRMASEVTGYAPLSRAADALSETQGAPDVPYAFGRMVRGAGEGALGAATVAGNVYGVGQAAKATGGALARVYRGGPAAELPAADAVGALRGRLAKAETAGPSQIQTLIDDAGARAAAAESKIKPVDWSQVDMPEPAAAAAPQAPRDWAINIEGRTAPGRLRPRAEPDAYTPLDMTPEEQAAIDLSRQYQGRTSMWDQPSLSPAGPRAPAALSPEQKAAMNAEIERLALQAEDAGKAGDTGAVAKAHEDIASIMARTGRPLETSPRLQAIQDRIDAIDRELKTADGAWREEELLAEAEALMNERRELRGKAPRQGALGNSSTLGMGGGNLWDDSGMSVADSIGNFVRKLRKSPAGDQEPTFRASEPNLTFGGQRAATADTGALAKAQELDAAGAPREQIWAETGWFKGVDEKWRFEIDDSGARLSDVATSDLNRLSEYSGTLKNGFDHPDLFKAYPSLAPEKFDAYTVPFQRGARFQEAGSSPYTAAGGPNAASIRSATLHESMHGVQGAEGFATGSSYKRVMENPELRAEAFAAARENLRPVAFDDYAAKWEIPDTPYARADHASLVKQQQQALQNLDALEQKADWTGQTDVPQALKNATDTLYRRHAGEVEARNVQTRRDWTPEQRRETPPWMSQDISDDQQIVTFSSASASDTSPTILGSNGGNLGAEGGALSRRSGQAPWVDERGLIPALKKMAEENGGKLPNGYANRLSEQFQMPAQTVRSRVARLRESNADIQKIAPQREFNRTDLTDRDVMIGIADGDRTIDIAADFNASRNSVNAKAKAMENSIRKRLADGEDKTAIAKEYGVTDDVLDAFLRPRKTGPKASRTIAGAGLVAGTTYLPARLAADFAADQQEEGALPAWMANLPRDPVSATPGL